MVVMRVVRMVMRMVVSIRILVVTLLAVEHQEVKAERIKSGDKNPRQHSKVRKTGTRQMALVYGFNDAVF